MHAYTLDAVLFKAKYLQSTIVHIVYSMLQANIIFVNIQNEISRISVNFVSLRLPKAIKTVNETSPAPTDVFQDRASFVRSKETFDKIVNKRLYA